MQDFAGDDRQQGSCAAEQDRHHVQRYRPQHRRLGTDETQPLEKVLPAGLAGSGVALGTHRPRTDDERDRRGEEQRGDTVDHCGPKRIDETGDGGCGDGRNLEGRGAHRHCGRQQRVRHQRGQQRLHRRHLEGPADAVCGKQHVNERQGQKVEGRAKREQQQGKELQRLRRGHHAPPLEAVGELASHRHQHQLGEELHQPDKSERKGAARQIVDLPGDRHGKHLVGTRTADPCKPVGDEGGMGKESGICVSHCG